MLRVLSIAAISLVAALAACTRDRPAPLSPAARAESAARGLEVAEKSCAECHRVKPTQRTVENEEMAAPDFAAIAARREVDAGYLRRFMEVQHLPMTASRLYSDDKADVVAYMLSLKGAR